MKRSRLRRVSDRRLLETKLYRFRARQFLLDHPYCQVWLAEHGISEETAMREGGAVSLPNGFRVAVPLSTQVHHMNKRRGVDLLDEQHWLAVSAAYHRRLEEDKTWARAKGYLFDF